MTRSWSTAARRAPTFAAELAGRGIDRLAALASPTTSPTTTAASRRLLERLARHDCSSRAQPRTWPRRAAAGTRRPVWSPGPGPLREPAARGPVAAAGASSRGPRAGPTTRTCPRWCSLLAGTRFRALLTGDAEAEAVPIDPGPVDVLKVAHHGCDDAGLDATARPRGAGARGDLGRRGEPLRPSDAATPRRPSHRGCRRDPHRRGRGR